MTVQDSNCLSFKKQLPLFTKVGGNIVNLMDIASLMLKVAQASDLKKAIAAILNFEELLFPFY